MVLLLDYGTILLIWAYFWSPVLLIYTIDTSSGPALQSDGPVARGFG